MAAPSSLVGDFGASSQVRRSAINYWTETHLHSRLELLTTLRHHNYFECHPMPPPPPPPAPPLPRPPLRHAFYFPTHLHMFKVAQV